jgi:hypothetical protein
MAVLYPFTATDEKCRLGVQRRRGVSAIAWHRRAQPSGRKIIRHGPAEKAPATVAIQLHEKAFQVLTAWADETSMQMARRPYSGKIDELILCHSATAINHVSCGHLSESPQRMITVAHRTRRLRKTRWSNLKGVQVAESGIESTESDAVFGDEERTLRQQLPPAEASLTVTRSRRCYSSISASGLRYRRATPRL